MSLENVIQVSSETVVRVCRPGIVAAAPDEPARGGPAVEAYTGAAPPPPPPLRRDQGKIEAAGSQLCIVWPWWSARKAVERVGECMLRRTKTIMPQVVHVHANYLRAIPRPPSAQSLKSPARALSRR